MNPLRSITPHSCSCSASFDPVHLLSFQTHFTPTAPEFHHFHPKTHEPRITRTWTKERPSRRRCAAWLPPYCWDKRSTGTICNASMSTGLNIIKFLKVKRSQLLGPVSGLHDYIRILDFPAYWKPNLTMKNWESETILRGRIEPNEDYPMIRYISFTPTPRSVESTLFHFQPLQSAINVIYSSNQVDVSGNLYRGYP